MPIRCPKCGEAGKNRYQCAEPAPTSEWGGEERSPITAVRRGSEASARVGILSFGHVLRDWKAALQRSQKRVYAWSSFAVASPAAGAPAAAVVAPPPPGGASIAPFARVATK